MKTFATTFELERYIRPRVRIALEKASIEITLKLRDFIQSEFYDKYEPEVYDRTYKFLDSALYNMISYNKSEVFINKDYDNDYKTIDSSQQAGYAYKGLHGGFIFREGYFWESFMEWVDINWKTIIKLKLVEQGLKIVK